MWDCGYITSPIFLQTCEGQKTFSIICTLTLAGSAAALSPASVIFWKVFRGCLEGKYFFIVLDNAMVYRNIIVFYTMRSLAALFLVFKTIVFYI
jgi:hypothetical protein